MNLIDHILERQYVQIGEFPRGSHIVCFDYQRRFRIDCTHNFCRFILQSKVVDRCARVMLRFIDEVVSIERRMSLDCLCQPPPRLKKGVGIFPVVKHLHFAVRPSTARCDMEIKHHLHTELLRLIENLLDLRNTPVDPGKVLFDIPVVSHLVPVANQLPANQIGPPAAQIRQVFRNHRVAEPGRRHRPSSARST